MPEKRPFLRHIHYFRAVAILFVVTSHVPLIPFFLTGAKDPIFGVWFLFFTNATVFFVLISGFLFQYISDNNAFRYWSLMKKKFLYLFVPMVVMSIPATIGIAYVSPGPPTEKLILGMIGAAHWAILSSPLWYIFFVLMMFAASPLIVKFIRWRYSLAITLLVIPLGFFFFPRTLPVWPGVIPYFSPLFVLGAIMSYRYDRVQEFINRYFLLCGCLAIVLMVLCILVPAELGEPLKFGFNNSIRRGVNSLLSGYFKIFLALFFWGLLIRFEYLESRAMNLVANYSFGIFFIHSYFLTLSLVFYRQLWPSSRPLSYLVTLGYCIAWPLLALAIAMLLKLIFGRYARYVAGV